MKKLVARLLFFILIVGTNLPTVSAISFSDIANDPHQEAIEYLQSKNIIQGYQDGTFQPNRTLNRAELLKLAVIATHANGKFDYPTFVAYDKCFPDVNGQWFASYVCFAKSHGWVQGYADGNFHPEQEVNKVEAIKMITLINELKEGDQPTVEFKDVPTTAWYYPYLQTAQINNLLEEEGDYYYPGNSMSRGAAAEVLYRLLTGKESTPPPNTTTIGKCDPLNTVIGTTINVSNVDELRTAVAKANETGNVTILLKNGTYNFSGEGLWVSGSNIIFRSASGNRDAVILKGEGMTGKTTRIFFLAGKNITIADMSLGGVANHVIQIHGELDADGALLHNLHITDGYEQLVKVSYDASKMDLGADNGILECSTLEYTAGIGPQFYIGGIDAHNAANWLVKNNLFIAIKSPEEALAEDAVHFWSSSKNTVVENNTFLNCDRAIGFGMGEDRGENGGAIRNNKIYHNSTRGDAGIILETAKDVTVENNIILMENDYPNAIEYRFTGTTGAQILNNITNKAIKQRDGATGTISGNITNAKIGDYADPAHGNFTKI